MKNMVYYQSYRRERKAKAKLKSRLKKLEKSLKNPLTNRQQSDIINKLSTERSRRNRSLKIEQQ